MFSFCFNQFDHHPKKFQICLDLYLRISTISIATKALKRSKCNTKIFSRTLKRYSL